MNELLPSETLFRFHWLDGKVEELRGHGAADALNRAGYGQGAIRALDYWERVEESGFSAETLEMLEDAEREDYFGE